MMHGTTNIKFKKCILLYKRNLFRILTALLRLDVVTEVSGSHSDALRSVGLQDERSTLYEETLLEKTQHSQETDIHVHGGIRTRNPSKRAAADQSHCLT